MTVNVSFLYDDDHYFDVYVLQSILYPNINGRTLHPNHELLFTRQRSKNLSGVGTYVFPSQ